MDDKTRGNHPIFFTVCKTYIVMLLLLQTFLASDELGDSLNGVEALIKKHEDFEKTLVAWEEKFKASKT